MTLPPTDTDAIDALDALFAEIEAAPPEPVLHDRSGLERYDRCPCQGAAVESGAVTDTSRAADSGNAAHDAYGGIVDGFVQGCADARELVEVGLSIARRPMVDGHQRPDIQPDVLEAVRPSLWRFARELVWLPGEPVRRNPADVLRYQGGQGERSGQLAVDFIESKPGKAGARLTSELDLLQAGPAENVLCETDWKSGHRPWCATDVRQAFQFRLHNWLVMKNYPDCEALLVRVWMTRMNRDTGWVRFTRRDAQDTEARLLMILMERDEALAALSAGKPPAVNAYYDNCILCPAWKKCPLCHQDVAVLMDDPEGFLAETAAVLANLEHRQKLLHAYVAEHGELRGGGLVCGYKPPAKRKASITLFQDKESEDG